MRGQIQHFYCIQKSFILKSCVLGGAKFVILILYTVELGYSELGYNELPLIANKLKILVGSSQFNSIPSWL